MLRFTLLGAALVAATVIIHAIGSTWWLRFTGRHYTASDGTIIGRKSLQALIGTVLVMLLLHTLEIVLWADVLLRILPDGELASYEEAVYFSFVTFTTLGYGDITLSEGWRLLSGIEALNGIMLVGWTTAMLFSVVQKTWQGLAHRKSGSVDDAA